MFALCTQGGRDEGVNHLVESDNVTADILLERSRHGLVFNEPRTVSEQRTAGCGVESPASVADRTYSINPSNIP
jgi:hypothetical protein